MSWVLHSCSTPTRKASKPLSQAPRCVASTTKMLTDPAASRPLPTSAGGGRPVLSFQSPLRPSSRAPLSSWLKLSLGFSPATEAVSIGNMAIATTYPAIYTTSWAAAASPRQLDFNPPILSSKFKKHTPVVNAGGYHSHNGRTGLPGERCKCHQLPQASRAARRNICNQRLRFGHLAKLAMARRRIRPMSTHQSGTSFRIFSCRSRAATPKLTDYDPAPYPMDLLIELAGDCPGCHDRPRAVPRSRLALPPCLQRQLQVSAGSPQRRYFEYVIAPGWQVEVETTRNQLLSVAIIGRGSQSAFRALGR